MADNNTKYSSWLLLVAGAFFALLLLTYFLFPALVSKFASLIGGLLVVVTGLFLRRKK
jgi:uncharacterized membrane protein YjjP (DUF1212 family)